MHAGAPCVQWLELCAFIASARVQSLSTFGRGTKISQAMQPDQKKKNPPNK